LKTDLKIDLSGYEKKVITRTGLQISMRPIKPEDTALLVDLFNSLSPQTIYYRFFSNLKKMPDDMLKRFTQIDYDRDMAFVALDEFDSKERILAVARFISIPNQSDAEFAVVVGDEWQGKGIGRVLLENLISYAMERKIKILSGYVLAENIYMLSLGRQLGFSLTRIRCEDQYFLKMDLESMGDKSAKQG
jgi:acetyltransferase